MGLDSLQSGFKSHLIFPETPDGRQGVGYYPGFIDKET